MLIVSYLVIMIAAYLLGSLPTGYLAGKIRGVDIRKVGSGNMGATNVFRVLGRTAGIVVLVLDGLKGYAACIWLVDLARLWLAVPAEHLETVRIVAGICAVLGHNYTCWLGFKGGKGIATSAGVYAALAPVSVTISIATWAIAFVLTRYVSIASIAAAVALPVAVWLLSSSLLLQIVTTALGLMAILKHRGNIQRLLKGTENRFGNKRPMQEGTVSTGKP